MSFTLEDGSGVPGSKTFASVAVADRYFSDRGNSDWVGLTEAVKQKDLLDATEYVEKQVPPCLGGLALRHGPGALLAAHRRLRPGRPAAERRAQGTHRLHMPPGAAVRV